MSKRAKRSRARKKQTRAQAPTLNQIAPPPNKGQVTISAKQAQATHLDLIEEWGREVPTISGVPLALALGYNLIQYINAMVRQASMPPQEVAHGK